MVRLPLTILAVLLASAVPGDAQAPAEAPALLVVNQYTHALTVVDPVTRAVRAEVETGVNGHEGVVSPDGRLAYVPIYGSSGLGRPGTDGGVIDVIDLASLKRVRTIDLGQPVRPHGAHFGPDGLLYVTAELANAVFVVDPRQAKVVGRIDTGRPQSHMLALSPDGRRGYTANVDTGTISVLDLRARRLVKVIPVSSGVQRVSITPDGRRVFTHDQTSQRLAVIDTRSNAVSHWIPLPGVPYASAVTPDGRRLVVGSQVPAVGERGPSRIFVVDLKSEHVIATLDAPGPPNSVLITPGGERAYVSSSRAGKVGVVDLRTLTLEPEITLVPGSDGLALWSKPVARR